MRQPGVIFEPLAAAPSWPSPPEPTRIVYLGQLSTSVDLKPGKSFFDRFGETLFGKESARGLLTPYAVCTRGDRVFVADSNGKVVHMFDLGTRQYRQFQPSRGAKDPKRFSQPVGIVCDRQGRIIVSDSVAGALFVFDQDGTFLKQMGAGDLTRPCGLAVDPNDGRLFVADPGTHQVVIFSPEGQLLGRLGSHGNQLGQFNYPTNVAVDSRGRLYVSDSLNFRVQRFDADLQPTLVIGKQGDLPGYFSQPKGLAVDSEDHLYVVDAHFEAVQVFNADGRLLLSFGEEGRGPGQFWLPAGIHIDDRDRIWVADSYNRRIQVFTYLPESQP